MNSELELSKYKSMSSSGIVIVLYDGECSLCISASSVAVRILSKRFKVIKSSIQSALNKTLTSQDDFTVIMPYNHIFKGADAWIEIFGSQNSITCFLKPLMKFYPIRCIIIIMYKIVSKLRKFFNKKECNCK